MQYNAELLKTLIEIVIQKANERTSANQLIKRAIKNRVTQDLIVKTQYIVIWVIKMFSMSHPDVLRCFMIIRWRTHVCVCVCTKALPDSAFCYVCVCL